MRLETRTSVPYHFVALVALVAGAVGVASILLSIGEMDDFLKSYLLVAVVSLLLWLLLAKRVKDKPLWVSAAIGLVSPAVACLALAPVGIGIYWAIVLAQFWYFTLPIALATGLVMHLVVNGSQANRT